MNRKWIKDKLSKYQPVDHEDEKNWQLLCSFVEKNPDCFDEKKVDGHITGSAWLLSPDLKKVLLTHHKKLGKWMQLGGHADGEANVFNVALREAKEESGIQDIEALSEDIFDVDVHLIPERKDKLAHYHYDVRFLLKTCHEKFIVSGESHDLAWISIKDVETFNEDRSITRMVEKSILFLKNPS